MPARFHLLRYGAGLMLFAAVPVCAQSPSDRAAIARFSDSLENLEDSSALRGLEARLIEVAKADRDNAMHHLRLGFVALRLGDVSGKTHYDDAAGEFEWATELQPQWPWGWYGLGIAEDRIGDSEVSLVQGLQAMFGKDHLSRAANAYAHSVQVDPSFVRGLVDLAATALRQRINIKIDLAREALRQAALTSAAANPEVLLYRGRVEREVGDIDSATAAFRGYLVRGGNRGLGLLELARTELLRGSLRGQLPYYEGAASDDSTSVAGYRQDLEVIANDSALAEFDHSTAARRVAFLHRFWGQRDRASLLVDGARLCEHYRRIFYARKNFQLVSSNRHYDIVERFRSGNPDFDDRGVIYIRHGEPTERASYDAPGMPLNESWYYKRADGDLVFHFVAREKVGDYRLVESVFDILGFGRSLAIRGDRESPADAERADQLVLTREDFSPVYTHLLSSSNVGAQKYFTEERMLGRHSIAIGTHSDSYEISYARHLDALTSVVVAGHDSSESLLHVSYAMPGSALHEVPSDRGHLYPVRLRLSVTDRTGRLVAAIDTTRLFLATDPVPAQEHLVGQVSVPVIPGELVYRIALEQGSDNGTVLPADTITAGDFEGHLFSLSGLVVGLRDAHLAWLPAPGDTVWFNPLGRFRRAAEMELYYEVYGAPAGAGLKTEVAVTKEGGGGFLGLFGSKKPAIHLGFEDQSEGTESRFHRTLSLERLSTGRYHLDVSVTNPDGVTRRSHATFEVVP